ncbi:MAG: serine--tRNA ligase, partial [Candidatus Aminicenantes bacterium]|nr:serine--tRNA ligase [Candidatus Aminicenantes bacterium]
MLDLKFVLENRELVVQKMTARGLRLDFDELASLAEKRKGVLKRVEDLRAEKNRASDEVGRLKREGKDVTQLISQMKGVGEDISRLEQELSGLDERLQEILLHLPNLPDESVPEGKSSEDNVEVRSFGDKPRFSFPVLPHWEVGKRLGILDFERAAKIAGSRFVVYRGAGALLERALINFMLDIQTKERGYT